MIFSHNFSLVLENEHLGLPLSYILGTRAVSGRQQKETLEFGW